MSWKIQLRDDDSGDWTDDLNRFETKPEAASFARDLTQKCSAIRETRFEQSKDPINARWEQGMVVKVKEKKPFRNSA